MIGFNYGWISDLWATLEVDTTCTITEMDAGREHWITTRPPTWGDLSLPTPMDPNMTIGQFKAEVTSRTTTSAFVPPGWNPTTAQQAEMDQAAATIQNDIPFAA